MYTRQKLPAAKKQLLGADPGIASDENNGKWFAYIGIALGTVLALILIAIRLYQPLGLAITIQLTSLGYLLLKERLRAPSPIVGEREKDARSTPLAGFFVVVVALVALLTIATSADALQRPVWVFLVLATIPGFVLAQRVLFPKMRDQAPLVQVIMLTAAIVLTSVTVFPHNGGDTWAHLYNAEVILENRSVQAIAGAYRDYPLYPAVLSILSASMGLDVAQAARFLNVFVAVTCLVLLYLISKQCHSSLESLALILLLSGSKWFVHWTTLVVSMNMAMLFFCLLMVVLFRRLYKPVDTRETVILFLVAGMAPFFHPVGAVATIFLLVGFWALETFRVGEVVGRVQVVDDQHPKNRRSLIGLAGVVIIFTLTQWMYFGDFIFDRTVQSLANAIFTGDSSVKLASSHRDVIVYTLDQLNFYALLGLAGLEIMRQLFLRLDLKVDRLNLYAGLLGLAFVAFGYATQAVSLLGVLPYRWFLFGTLLLVFPASSAFASLFKSRWGRAVAVGLVVIYFFTGLTNTENNRDHPFYGYAVTQLFELTSSEYAGLLALQQAAQERDVDVRVDFRLWDYMKYVLKDDRIGYWRQIQMDGFDGVFPFRTAYLRYLVLVDSSAYPVDCKQPYLSQFYDSGDMQLLDYVGQTAPKEQEMAR